MRFGTTVESYDGEKILLQGGELHRQDSRSHLLQGESQGQPRGDRFDEDRWSPRLRLLMVVLSSLILWTGIFLVASWIY